MKIRILLFLLLTASLFADDLTTNSGKIYYDYEILGVGESGCKIKHSSGTEIIPLDELPAKILEDYFERIMAASKGEESAEEAQDAADPGTKGVVSVAADAGDTNNSDTVWQDSPETTISPDETGTMSVLLTDDGRIGADNRIDYYKLNITDSGVYSFVVGYLESDVRITLYSPSGSELKKLKFAYGKSGRDGIIRDQFLESGLYYLSVEASGRTISGATGYAVGVYGVVTTEDEFEARREEALENAQARARANEEALRAENAAGRYYIDEIDLHRSLRNDIRNRNDHVRFLKQFNERRFIER